MKIKIEDRELIIKYKSKKYHKDIYEIICEDTMGLNLNEIHIKYEIKKEDNEIRIFGDEFIKNNYNICKIILNNKIFNLISHLNLKKMKNKKKFIEIKLRGIKSIRSAIRMFSNCSLLIKIPDISKWNTNKVNNLIGLFYGCSSLKSLSDISKWNSNKVNNLIGLFYGCSSLKSLPDISKWNINNVNYMSGLFYGCSSLKSLPDISKWNTNNVNNMSLLFAECSSLKTLPDISNWNTNNINDMSGLFLWMFIIKIIT